MFRVPIDDDGGEQVQTSHAVMLTLGGFIAGSALTTNAQGIFQTAVRHPLIQVNIGTSLHTGMKQPVDNEHRTLCAPGFPGVPGRVRIDTDWGRMLVRAGFAV